MERIFLISAGNGPKECEWVVGQLAGALKAEAESGRGSAEIIRSDDLETGPAKSLILDWKGPEVIGIPGTVCWIGTSPYRPRHKRRNWYVGVSRLGAAGEDFQVDPKDVRYKAMRASGPGGQHVNATDSAVRATHLPTGVSVVSRGERSQHANKRIALLKLMAVFAQKAQASRDQSKSAVWLQKLSLERGNPARVYQGRQFKLGKDKR